VRERARRIILAVLLAPAWACLAAGERLLDPSAAVTPLTWATLAAVVLLDVYVLVLAASPGAW